LGLSSNAADQLALSSNAADQLGLSSNGADQLGLSSNAATSCNHFLALQLNSSAMLMISWKRAAPQGRLLGIRTQFTSKVAEVAVSLSAACDPQVAAQAQRIYDVSHQRQIVGCRNPKVSPKIH
jgi:hypothetical protein